MGLLKRGVLRRACSNKDPKMFTNVHCTYNLFDYIEKGAPLSGWPFQTVSLYMLYSNSTPITCTVHNNLL